VPYCKPRLHNIRERELHVKKKFIIMIASCFALAGTASVWAEGSLKSIQVLFERINVSLNGQQANLTKDSILYNGSVYVPLRSLSEMLGADISWDDANRAVYLDFILKEPPNIQTATEKGIYQYIALQNNGILSDLIQAMKTTNTAEMLKVRDRYAELERLAQDLKDDQMYTYISKMEASVELLRGGWESKNLDHYAIAFKIFESNAAKLNDLLKTKLSSQADKR
jgi:uncharacterized protein YukE